MALGLLLSSTGLVGILLTRNLLFAFPMVFLIGSARAPSLVAYSILSTVRKGASRAGQFGFYLTLESLGVCIGILPRWVTLHSKPNKHLLYNVGVVHSPCNPSLGELPKEH